MAGESEPVPARLEFLFAQRGEVCQRVVTGSDTRLALRLR
jgi:hypothetical protein